MKGCHARLIALALAVMPCAVARASGGCGTAAVTEQRLEHIDGRLALLVTVKSARFFMLLDTASERSALTPAAVRRLGFATRELPKPAMVAAGKEAKLEALVPRLSVGELTLTDEHFAVYAEDSTRKWPDSVIGTMGIDLLWRYDIDLDIDQSRLALYRPGACRAENLLKGDYAASVPLRRGPSGSLYFIMDANGRKLETAFSTGGARSTMPRSLLRSAYGINDAVESIPMRLTAGALQFDHEIVHITDDAAGKCQLTRKPDAIGYENCVSQYPLVLGTDLLMRLHLFFATQQNQLYFALINLT